jgi:hypothetical protein
MTKLLAPLVAGKKHCHNVVMNLLNPENCRPAESHSSEGFT